MQECKGDGQATGGRTESGDGRIPNSHSYALAHFRGGPPPCLFVEPCPLSLAQGYEKKDGCKSKKKGGLHMGNVVFSAYVMNLELYNEGRLCGVRVDFPITHGGGVGLKEAVGKALGSIHVDGEGYGGYFIAGYQTDIKGLADCLGERENLFMLNFLARKIAGMDCGKAQFEAMLGFGKNTGSVEGLINLVDNAGCFYFMPEVADDYQLGYGYAVKSGLFAEELKNMGTLANFIDYEAYGRDIRLRDNGIHTENGYISLKDSIKIYFDPSKDGIPEFD